MAAPAPGKLFRAATRRWFGPTSDADRILKVTVHNENSQVVRVLDWQRDLVAFRELWAALVEADPGSWTPPPERLHYKLNIQSLRRGGRTESAVWLYFPGGYIELLAIWRAFWIAPLYRTLRPCVFEALLRGGDPSSPD